MVFESVWRSAGRVVPAMLAGAVLLAQARPASGEAGPPASGTSLRTVRVDLQAGAFLDPLPFDQAFLIVGRVPVSTRLVEARVDEYLGEPVSPTEGELRRFDASLRAYLAESGATGALTPAQARRVGELLVEQVRDDATPGALGRLWRYGVPWNWANWGDLFRAHEREVVAPGTLLDRPGLAEGAVDPVPSTAASLAETIAQQARAARIGTYAPARALRPPVRWRRLGEKGAESETEAQTETGFNQLVRLRALTGKPGDDPFSAAAQAQGEGEGRDWRAFRLLVDPLAAQRHYVFRFHLQRDPAEAEVEAFLGRARRRGGAVLAGAGYGALSVAQGERLRDVLVEGLEAATAGATAAAGGLLARSTPYVDVHEQLVGLAAMWRDVDTDDKARAVLEAELRDLAREQQLVEETDADAATADNDYVSADVGLVYAPTIGRTAATVGANFYLRPVNKGVPVSQIGGLGRFAFTGGLTLNSIEDRRRIRSDLYFNQGLILGAGYRVAQYWRLGAGGLVFRERDPDSYPLTRRRRTALTPYVALTADVDAGRQLKGIGGLLDFLKGGQ